MFIKIPAFKPDRYGIRKSDTGFTLIELLIAIAVLLIMGVIVIPNIILLQKNPPLNTAYEEVITLLRVAQSKTLSSEGNSQYGLYFDTASSPHRYIVFKGASYATRDSAFDRAYALPGTVEFSQINTGAASEVVFDKLTGSTANSGNISLRLKDGTGQAKTIYIGNSGTISPSEITSPFDDRLKDSRHIDFNYSRNINTASENIILTFNGSTVKTVPVNEHLNNGQIDWQETYDIGGSNQTVRIHTLRLNNPDTVFSVYRDLRFNDKSVVVELSGDATGALASYSADGSTVGTSSIYVNNFVWQ